jgi:hypothetical protein
MRSLANNLLKSFNHWLYLMMRRGKIPKPNCYSYNRSIINKNYITLMAIKIFQIKSGRLKSLESLPILAIR